MKDRWKINERKIDGSIDGRKIDEKKIDGRTIIDERKKK